ncbi:MAG: fibronectin type III domain-containing protein [Limisphaerales bacterium]
MQTFRVALGFARLPDADLSTFANKVIGSMTGNLTFPEPPVSFTELAQLQDAFHNAISAALDGGVSRTVAKKVARQSLVSAMRKTAAYVQIAAGHNMALLLASGFPAASRSRARTKLSKPVILAVENDGTAKLAVRMPPVANARSYEVRAMNGEPVPAATVISTQARRVVLKNLTPGTLYDIQARAIGGSEGYSEWCDPTTHMAM